MSKEIRNKINKKIDRNYNKRQRMLSEIKSSLDIHFNKITVFTDEIIIDPSDGLSSTEIINTEGIKRENSIKREKIPFFKIILPDSVIGSPAYHFEGKEINCLNLKELDELKHYLNFILKEIELKIENILT